MSRMRVLLALPDKRVRGGPPSHLYELRDALVEQGVEVRELLYGGRTHDEAFLTKLAGRFADLLAFPFQIARQRPDLIHLNSAFDRKGVARDVFFVGLARLLGRRILIKFHGSDLPFLERPPTAWRLACDVVVRGADLVCVLSEEERAAFRRRYPGVRVERVKNALNLGRYRAAYDFRERYAIPRERRLLLFVARFIASKGLREVLLALAGIRRHGVDAHAALVGDGEVRREMEALARSLDLEPFTTFTGYIPEQDTVSAYLAADALVFPTYHQEGMPMVIFHSLACGLPVVTTRIRAAADWLTDPERALFVPPRDAQALAAALLGLLQDPERARRLRDAGLKLVEGFERSRVAGDFIGLYRSLIDPGMSAAREAVGRGPSSEGATPGDGPR